MCKSSFEGIPTHLKEKAPKLILCWLAYIKNFSKEDLWQDGLLIGWTDDLKLDRFVMDVFINLVNNLKNNFASGYHRKNGRHPIPKPAKIMV